MKIKKTLQQAKHKTTEPMNLLTFYIAAGSIALIIMIWLIFADRK